MWSWRGVGFVPYLSMTIHNKISLYKISIFKTLYSQQHKTGVHIRSEETRGCSFKVTNTKELIKLINVSIGFASQTYFLFNFLAHYVV